MQICCHNLQHCRCLFIYCFTKTEECKTVNTYRIIALLPNWSIKLFVKEGYIFLPTTLQIFCPISRRNIRVILKMNLLFNKIISNNKTCVIIVRLPIKWIKYLGQIACILEFRIKNNYFMSHLSGFGGLEVACWPLVHKFAGSNQAEAAGSLGRKNPQHAFPRRGSKALGPMS